MLKLNPYTNMTALWDNNVSDLLPMLKTVKGGYDKYNYMPVIYSLQKNVTYFILI